MAEIQYHELRDFAFEDGTVLPSLRLAYLDLPPAEPAEESGAAPAKTALVLTCFRGRLHSTCAYSEAPLAALRGHRVLVVALLGNGESASPSNTPGFPGATAGYGDCVAAQRALLAALGVARLDVVVGFSMGGQTAYHWLARHPDMVRRAVVVCSSARTSRHNHQFLEGPRAALENSIDYVPIAQRTPATPPCRRGLHAFGKAYSAWLASADWFDAEGYRQLGFASLAAWDAAATGRNYAGWDPDDLLAQLGMWQRGDVTGGGGTVQETLARIAQPVLLLPSRSDQYFRWEAAAREAEWLPRATFRPIPSVWGHMAGLGINPEDAKWVDGEIGKFLGETEGIE